jgi:hypothetical protein
MKKSICIASIPERQDMLKKTVESLKGQYDNLYVALNNYPEIPSFLKNAEVVQLDNSMGDAGKFWFTEHLDGYIFTCDDDLIYPPDYVKYMIKGIVKYKCPVTLHGKTYPRPFKSFGDTMANYRCLDTVDSDGRVDVGGTGVMAWHTADLKIKYSDIQSKNMADCWFAKAAHEQGVRIMCLAHKQGSLLDQRPVETIWIQEKAKGFKEQTEILKSFLP